MFLSACLGATTAAAAMAAALLGIGTADASLAPLFCPHEIADNGNNGCGNEEDYNGVGYDGLIHRFTSFRSVRIRS